MTEIAVDSAATAEQPGDAAPSESISEMGMGFIEATDAPDSGDASAEQPAAGDGEVAAPPLQPTNDTPSPSQQQADDDSGDGLRLADYTRKTQAVADERREVAADKRQVAAERAQIAEERRIYAEAQARASQPPQANPLEQLAAQLGPEEARGLTVVDQLVQERAQEIATKLIEEQIGPLRPDLERLNSTIGVVDQLQQQQTAVHRSNANAQIEAAEAVFGKVDAWTESQRGIVGALTRHENPDTGEAFTVAEAMSLATGRRLTDQGSAVTQQRQARNNAKRSTATQAGSPPLTETAGVISKAQAMSEIKATM
jgi:hypothetical protein